MLLALDGRPPALLHPCSGSLGFPAPLPVALPLASVNVRVLPLPPAVKPPALVTVPKVWFALSVSVSTRSLVSGAFATTAVSV